MEKIQHRRTTVVIFILLAIPFLIVGLTLCAYGVKKGMTHLKHLRRLARAKSNAAAYIEEKYGFSATALDAQTGTDYGLFSSWESDSVLVHMDGGGREFDVLIDGGQETTDGLDSYQEETLRSDLLEMIDTALPGGTVRDFHCGYGAGEGIAYDGWMLREYYDGQNAADVLREWDNQLTMLYTDTDFADHPLFDTLQDLHIRAGFYSFDSAEMTEALAADTAERDFDLYAPYITNYRRIFESRNEQRFFDLHDAEGFLYCQMFSGGAADMQQTDSAPMEQALAEQSGKRQLISPVYRFSGAERSVIVWIPLDSYPVIRSHLVDAMELQSYPGRAPQLLMHSVRICGDYAAFRLEDGSAPFALADTGWDRAEDAP